ncbi:MAG: hypothetical protein RJA99_2918 [Pseudomonadota bacterium]|jgi:hypothetical protein
MPDRRWRTWLLAASLGVSLFGLTLVVAPSLARRGFSLMIYGSPQAIDGFGAEAARYASLVHAVLGAVMVGWGLALFHAVRSFFIARPRATWQLVAGSLLAWFVPDTTYSLASGFWQNAVLNVGFAMLFAVPLWASRGARQFADGR